MNTLKKIFTATLLVSCVAMQAQNGAIEDAIAIQKYGAAHT